MSVKKRGLNRGLDALLSQLSATASPISSDNQMCSLSVTVLQRGKYQPRKAIEPAALQELADSIRAQGIIQPIIVRSIGNNRYEIIAGERRWRAAQLAGLTEVPVVIREVSDEAAIAMALIENIQREDLNPIEEANALHRLLNEFAMTHQQIADAVGKARPTITNILRLTGLHEEVKKMLERGELEKGHAIVLLVLSGAAQLQAAKTIFAKGLSVREAEHLVRKLQKAPVAIHIAKSQDPNVKHLQQNLSDKLAAKVIIKHNIRGKGKLIIQYNSLEELDGILAHIR